MNEYLWDRTGAPDPEVQQIEELLRPLRLQSERAMSRRRRVPLRAIAACLVVTAVAWELLPNRFGRPTDWAIAGTGRKVLTGERLIAPNRSLALDSSAFGRIELRPGSELRVVESGPRSQRMTLERGELHALIWAAPRQFVVDTPSARAVDLGCQYDLAVNARGDGFLRVETGWVAFQAGRNESFIPAGAVCRTTKAHGPGLPYFADAPAAFRQAVESFERGGGDDALARILTGARREDGLTLWHLLRRVDAERRGVVFDRFAQLIPVPPAVTREKILERDPTALDLCWNALDLEDAAWWREWKHEWK
jgi:hypothetical protein